VGKYYKLSKNRKSLIFKSKKIKTKDNGRVKVLSNFFLEKFFKIEPSKRLTRVCEYFYSQHLIRQKKKQYKYRKFIYDIIFYRPVAKTMFLKKRFASLRLVKMYYIMLTYKHLQKLAKKAKRMEGLFEANYFFLLECRLPSLMYRSALIGNMFEALKFVKANNV
jgi:ribosomal protein S4